MGRVPVYVQRCTLLRLRVTAVDHSTSAVLILNLEYAVGGFPYRAADISYGVLVPVGFLHRVRSDGVFVYAPFTGSPLDDFRGGTFEIPGNRSLLGRPPAVNTIESPVKWRGRHRLVRLIVVWSRLRRVRRNRGRAVGVRAGQVRRV